jgi:hypothetical protein
MLLANSPGRVAEHAGEFTLVEIITSTDPSAQFSMLDTCLDVDC